MIERLDAIGNKVLEQVRASESIQELESYRVDVLGKKGSLNAVLRDLKNVPGDERPKVGAKANEWKELLSGEIQSRRDALEKKELDASIAKEGIDIFLPSRKNHVGSLHPVTTTMHRIVDIFSRIGFEVALGPEVETEWLCFDSVNIPADHPARDMQDTFFVGPGVVLRTQTSPVQMRTMMSQKWPVRILCPGAVYRSDNDATHSPMFHQIEGLWVDRDVTMADLKGSLEFFARELFGSETEIRLRPSFFPFVEPGAEVDVSCVFCRKKKGNCKVCKDAGWIEILGAGMVHPKLFQEVGYSPEEVTGYAFGLGVDRIAMLLHGIPDLRLMFEGDRRFLEQFS